VTFSTGRSAIESAARLQRLAVRPVLKVTLAVQGMSDLGRTPVVFALRLHNVGHGTAVIEEVQLQVRGESVLSYGAGATPADLVHRVDVAVFQRAVGASVEALSGKLAVLPLSDEARALEAAGALDLLRVEVFAHNADAVEQGLEALGAIVRYRDLDGGHYSSAEQFRALAPTAGQDQQAAGR
jgi:hypothetical protein